MKDRKFEIQGANDFRDRGTYILTTSFLTLVHERINLHTVESCWHFIRVFG